MSLKIHTTDTDKEIKQYHFYCPACDTVHILNSKWTYNGDPENPTFSPSILTQGWSHNFVTGDSGPHYCHSHIEEGKIKYCGDSKHALAGKVVDLPDFPYELVKAYYPKN